MSNTVVIRQGGKTVALSVGATAHAAVQISGNTNDQINFASCLNTGSAPVTIKFSQLSTDVASIPVDGTPGDYVLPASMQWPITLAVPTINTQNPCYVTAIAGSGTNLVYITPAVDQS